jgi:hypothetical protein
MSLGAVAATSETNSPTKPHCSHWYLCRKRSRSSKSAVSYHSILEPQCGQGFVSVFFSGIWGEPAHSKPVEQNSAQGNGDPFKIRVVLSILKSASAPHGISTGLILIGQTYHAFRLLTPWPAARRHRPCRGASDGLYVIPQQSAHQSSAGLGFLAEIGHIAPTGFFQNSLMHCRRRSTSQGLQGRAAGSLGASSTPQLRLTDTRVPDRGRAEPLNQEHDPLEDDSLVAATRTEKGLDYVRL